MKEVRIYAGDLAGLRGYEVYALLNGHVPGVLSGKERGGCLPKLSKVCHDVATWTERQYGVVSELFPVESPSGSGGARTIRAWGRDGERVRFTVVYKRDESDEVNLPGL